MADANKNLVKQALELCAQIAQDMGSPVKVYAKKIMDGVLVNVADSKSLVKDAAVKTLETYTQLCGVATVLAHVPAALGKAGEPGTAVGGRKDILDVMVKALNQMLTKNIKKMPEMTEMVPAVLCCLEDKSAEVRASAEQMLVHVMRAVGFNAVKGETKSLKKATLLVLTPMIEKYRDSLPPTAADTAAGATASAAAPASAAAADDGDEKESKPAAAAKKGASDSKQSKTTAASAKSKTGEKTAAPAAAAAAKGKPAAAGKGAAAAKEKEKDDDGGGAEEAKGPGAGSCFSKKCDAKTRTKRLDVEMKRMKGAFREWQADEIDELKNELAMYFSDECMKKLFHPKNDFKAYVQAIEMIDSELPGQLATLQSVLDLGMRQHMHFDVLLAYSCVSLMWVDI